MNRTTILGLGMATVIGVTWVWHAPMGAADKFASGVEARSRTMLDHYEMRQVQARLERGPLTRRLILSGPADERVKDRSAAASSSVWFATPATSRR